MLKHFCIAAALAVIFATLAIVTRHDFTLSRLCLVGGVASVGYFFAVLCFGDRR